MTRLKLRPFWNNERKAFLKETLDYLEMLPLYALQLLFSIVLILILAYLLTGEPPILKGSIISDVLQPIIKLRHWLLLQVSTGIEDGTIWIWLWFGLGILAIFLISSIAGALKKLLLEGRGNDKIDKQ